VVGFNHIHRVSNCFFYSIYFLRYFLISRNIFCAVLREGGVLQFFLLKNRAHSKLVSIKMNTLIFKKSAKFFDNVLFFGALCYSVFWALLIFALPINKYEWMLDSPEDFDLDKAKGYCALPLDPDPTSAIEAFLLGCPYLLFAIFYTFRKHKKTKLLWSIYIILICAWYARFFIFAPHCA
jgi:hypothetical protein